jgi:hypothetical protein
VLPVELMSGVVLKRRVPNGRYPFFLPLGIHTPSHMRQVELASWAQATYPHLNPLIQSQTHTATQQRITETQDRSQAVTKDGLPEVGATRQRVSEKGSDSGPEEAPSRKAAKLAAARAASDTAATDAQEAEDGGYSTIPRGILRQQGGVIATGDERTCLADAMSVILCRLSGASLTPALSKKTIAWFVARVEADVSRHNDADPCQADAIAFATEHSFALRHVPNVSPRVLLQKRTGLFLVRLLIHFTSEGTPKVDAHFVVFDALHGHILDNLRGVGAIKVDDGDRKDNRSAIRPFAEKLFPDAEKVVLASVCCAI